MRVCQFRHDGKWTSIAAGKKAAASGRPAFLFYKHEDACQITSPKRGHPSPVPFSGGANYPPREPRRTRPLIFRFPYELAGFTGLSAPWRQLEWAPVQLCCSSLAFIVIFAFSTFDTGHPFSAASAYF